MAEAVTLGSGTAGLERHARAVSSLIAAGGLAQGLADHAFAQRGFDDDDAAASLAMAAAQGFARMVAASWRDGSGAPPSPPLPALRALERHGLANRITVKACEGYAFYAVYPELYVEAAARVRRGPTPKVIGLRSIGTSLAAAAAAGSGAARPLTVRPVGDPFDRRIKVAPMVAADLLGANDGDYLIVDEGPGQSGSSFGAVGDFLERNGARQERIVYLPSHRGAPGDRAPAERRARWASARRSVVDFDEAVAPRLPGWIEPLVGRLDGPLEDLSGGAWRAGLSRPPPAWPARERRKYLARTNAGVFLVKFAGLGEIGGRKLARARLLHGAGFAPEPIGLAHGFLVERWMTRAEAVEDMPRAALIDHLARYIGFRARVLPAEEGQGAGAAELLAMIRRNLALAGLDVAARRAAAIPLRGLAMRRIQTDGRLQAWEWLRLADGRLLKTDAIDHCEAHDLIGCQDAAWDVAGAAVEFDLSVPETERLRTSVEREAGRPVEPLLLEFLTVAYLAFQIGWWRLAAADGGGDEAAARERSYRRKCECRMAA